MAHFSNQKLNCLFFSIGGIFLGLIISYAINPPTSTSTSVFSEIRSKQNNSYTNPLLECENSQSTNETGLLTLKKSFENIIADQVSQNNAQFISIYYRDLNNGPWIGIKEKELFSPASLIKVPVMMAYYKEAETHPEILQKLIVNKEIYNPEDQNIDPETTVIANKEYSVEELINRMIIYSDNQAYETLAENIDNSKIYHIYDLLGINLSKAKDNPSGNIIRVKDYAAFYRILFNASYLNQTMSEKALKLLTQTKYTNALRAGVPKNIDVAHKFGERQFLPSHEKQLHDCGIIYHPQKPYLLCVMTRGQDFDNLSQTIKKISAATFAHVNQ